MVEVIRAQLRRAPTRLRHGASFDVQAMALLSVRGDNLRELREAAVRVRDSGLVGAFADIALSIGRPVRRGGTTHSGPRPQVKVEAS
jgi:hypothetical protein